MTTWCHVCGIQHSASKHARGRAVRRFGLCVGHAAALARGTRIARSCHAFGSALPGAHRGGVWGVKWVQKNDLGEVLVSVSTDGRVTQWDTKKGLVPTPIMTLKRARAPPGSNASAALAPTNKAPPGGMDAGVSAQAVTSEALERLVLKGLLSRTASGLTIDFVKEDPSQYFVGACSLYCRQSTGCAQFSSACRNGGWPRSAVGTSCSDHVSQHASSSCWASVSHLPVTLSVPCLAHCLRLIGRCASGTFRWATSCPLLELMRMSPHMCRDFIRRPPKPLPVTFSVDSIT